MYSDNDYKKKINLSFKLFFKSYIAMRLSEFLARGKLKEVFFNKKIFMWQIVHVQTRTKSLHRYVLWSICPLFYLSKIIIIIICEYVSVFYIYIYFPKLIYLSLFICACVLGKEIKRELEGKKDKEILHVCIYKCVVHVWSEYKRVIEIEKFIAYA